MMWFAHDNDLAFVQSRRDRGCVPVAADETDVVRDIIMENAPADEPLPLSVSRLCRAVGFMGYPCVTAFSAWLAYRKFPRLKEHLNNGRRKDTERQPS